MVEFWAYQHAILVQANNALGRSTSVHTGPSLDSVVTQRDRAQWIILGTDILLYYRKSTFTYMFIYFVNFI